MAVSVGHKKSSATIDNPFNRNNNQIITRQNSSGHNFGWEEPDGYRYITTLTSHIVYIHTWAKITKFVVE